LSEEHIPSTPFITRVPRNNIPTKKSVSVGTQTMVTSRGQNSGPAPVSYYHAGHASAKAVGVPISHGITSRIEGIQKISDDQCVYVGHSTGCKLHYLML